MRSVRLLLISAALSFVALTASAHTRVDLVIVHGTVVTISGANIDNGAIAVNDGKIVAVGTAGEITSKYAGRETLDASGMAVMPGFVNTHTHVPMTLFRGIADDRDLMDWLTNFIFPAEAKNVTADFVKWGTRLGAAEMIRSGTTTFADMYYFEDEIARETRRAGLRGVLGETMIDFPAPDNKTWSDAVAFVRKFSSEFRNDRLITPALAPHAPYTVSEEHLKEVRSLANELHAPILIHVAETQDELKQIAEKHNGKRSGEYLDSIGFLGDDVVAAHCVWLSPEESKMFAARKVGIAHCPESNMMLASGVAPVTEFIHDGNEVGLGTDGPAGSNNNLDMIEEMGSAARLQKVTQHDPKAVSAKEILKVATLGGAKVLGLDRKIGSLEAGKEADIILVNLRDVQTEPVYSVESAIVYAANGRDVDTTIVAGQILMRHRKLTTINVAETIEKAKEIRAKVSASLTKH